MEPANNDPSLSARSNAEPSLGNNGWSIDDRFAALADEMPGFGGFFYDGGTAVVYLVDGSQRTLARNSLGRDFGLSPNAKIEFRQALYNFRQLKTWHDNMSEILAVPGVILTDIDETKNRVRIGVESLSISRPYIMKLVRDRGVPDQAIVIEQVEPVYFAKTLRDRVRAVGGGLQINYSGSLCTLGVKATTFAEPDVPLFVTASHCSDNQGAADGTRYYQPNSSSESNFIGTEIKDPPYHTGYWEGGLCAPNRRCRFSDANLSRFRDVVPVGTDDLDIIRTKGRPGSIEVDAWFTITAVRRIEPNVGRVVEKIGRSTGWTYGEIAATCVYVSVSDSNVSLRCQHRVSSSQQIVAGGDSGSPVFYWWNNPYEEVTLFGILWGGSDDGRNFWFSDMGAVEHELGGMKY